MKEQVSNLHARLIAAFIDSNVIAACVLIGFILYDHFFSPNKIWLYLITSGILLAYEPLAVSWRGQTLGHWYKNIQIIDARSGERIGFLRALFRYIIKYTIWPLSISWMVFSHWHHSIQDLFTNSRVISTGKIEITITARIVTAAKMRIRYLSADATANSSTSVQSAAPRDNDSITVMSPEPTAITDISRSHFEMRVRIIARLIPITGTWVRAIRFGSSQIPKKRD